MNPQDLLKALFIHASYVGAAAVAGVAAGPDGLLVSDDVSVADNELRGKNVLVYELAKIHYHAILRAFADKSGVWPDPKPTPGGVSVGVQAGGADVLVNALRAARPDAPISSVASLLALLGAAAGPALGATPAPGEELK